MTDNPKVSDAEALAWGNALSDADKATAKNQVLYNRWLELQMPEKPVDVASLSDQAFREYAQREFTKTEKRKRGDG
jgi:hypothetical protein